MAKIYKECDGVTPVNHNIEIQELDSCHFYQSSWVGSCLHETYHQDLDIYDTYTINAIDDYTVKVKLDFKFDVWQNDGGGIKGDHIYGYVNYEYIYVDILQGTDNTTWNEECRHDIECTSTISEKIYTGYTVETQAVVPTCIPDPPACTLEITGTTTTPPSQRGEDDGTITAGVSGMTGSTITWTINGDPHGGSGASTTFTGLEAGSYYITASEGPCNDNATQVVADGEFRTGPFTIISPATYGYPVAAENPIMVNVATAISSASPLPSINLFFVASTMSDIVVEFNLTYPYVYSARFESKGFPDRSNYFLESVLTDEVGTPVGTNSYIEIMTSFAEALQADPVLSRLYYIFAEDPQYVWMTSKEYNSEYDLHNYSNVTITGTGSFDMGNFQPGVTEFDGQISSNYSVYCELFVDDTSQYGATEDDITYRPVTELELPFQKNNQHQFDLSKTLKNFVSSPKINFDVSGVTYISDAICSYYTKVGEKYPLIPNSNTKKKRYKATTGFNWCINSALNFEDTNNMSDYFPLTGSTVKFLNTAANTKYSHREGKEYLNTVMVENYEYPTAVFADINMYDGTVYSGVKLYDITTSGSTTNYGGVVVLPVAYACTCINTYETGGAKIRSVDITMKYSTDDGATFLPYSETKTFKFELDEQPANFKVAFLNRFGTYETYVFVGEVIDESEVNRELYQRPYDIGFDGAAARGFEHNAVLNTDYTKVFTLNTGIIDSDTYEYLQGLIQSNRIYHYDDEHQTYLQILSQSSTKSTNTNEYSLSIKVRETIKENNVSQ